MSVDKKNKCDTLCEMVAKLRKEKKLSYEDISKKGMIPASVVEQIEKGMVSPSVGAIKKITKALGIPLADFFQQAGLSPEEVNSMASARETVHIPVNKRKSLQVKGSMAFIQYLTPINVERNLELLWQEVEPRASGGDWLTHEGEECCLVIKGQFRIYVGDETHDLNEGDTLWFRTHQRHKWENRSKEPAVVLWAITPPYHGKV